MSALDLFTPPVRTWFAARFGTPTPPQAMAWPALAAGRSALVIAPTGSGKTLAAFLTAIDRLHRDPPRAPGVRVVYVSPLRALSNDIHRNLEEPLAGIRDAAGPGAPDIRAALRTGDTSPRDREALVQDPPHVLVTTPESLFLLLQSERARAMLRTLETVIVDEVHALAGNKRGAHLAITLERLERFCDRPLQRIGCSATVRPVDDIAAWLAGSSGGRPRPVEIFDAGTRKAMDLEVVAPVPDFRDLPEKTVWPAVEQQLLDLIRSHRSTLAFVNKKTAAERLASRVNDLAGEEIVAVHHASVSRERRLETERRLAAGELPAIVATSSLELGIDVGAIDLVVQIESPKSAARGLQRVGRAGHLLTETSVGRIIPLYRADLADSAAVARSMLAREVERTRIPRNCLDVLAQQVVATAAVEDTGVEDLYRLVRDAYNFRDLPRAHYEETLSMVSGAYPAARFGALRPRLDWDRATGILSARPGTARVVLMNAGTIPDRGAYTVVHTGTGATLGSLEEEFVLGSRVGDAFVLGTSVWRIENIGMSTVQVTDAPNAIPRLPFWSGSALGRPYEHGRRHGEFARELAARLDDPDCVEWLRETCAMDANAALALRTFYADMREAAGVIPDDRTILIETFPDQLGDLRTVIHSPFGERVHAGWGFAIKRHLRDTVGLDAEMLVGDDGIMFRFPAGEEGPPVGEMLAVDATAVEDLLVRELENTPLFGMLFREGAARALLIPRHSFRGRMPLHLQRLKAADLLQLTRRHKNFPLVLEASREALDEHLEIGSLVELLRRVDSGEIQVVTRELDSPSPFAATYLVRFAREVLYGNDQPRAEWRNRLLSLDREVLSEILSKEELRTLLDPRAIEEVETRIRAWAAEHPEPAGEEAQERGDAVALLRRYARTHGPFHADDFALAYGVSQTAVNMALVTLQAEGTIASGEFTRGRTGREWCDAENLQMIHRRSLALARKEVEPVAPEAFAAFLLDRHGVGAERAGSPAALRDALGLLEGAVCPAEALERDLLPARMSAYDPAWLDELMAEGAIAWQGAGRARVALFGRGDLAMFARVPGEPANHAVLDALRTRGPSFLAELAGACGLPEDETIEALWALAWSGAVSNDRFEPLRRLRAGGLPAPPTMRTARTKWALRQRVAARAIAAAPAGGGRWWALPEPAEAAALARAEAWAVALLRRYGVVSWEMASAEGFPVRWSVLRDVFDRWEATGEARRGYFVRGLSGIQYAAPDAVERLRASRSARMRLVSATDPANPYGSILPLIADARVRFARVPGSSLVVEGGLPLLLAERRGRRIVPLRELGDERLGEALSLLDGLLQGPGARARRRIEIEWFGDAPVAATPAAGVLAGLGYEHGPRAMVKRPPV